MAVACPRDCKAGNATLYQSDSVLVDRVDTEELGRYIRALADAAYEAMTGVNQPEMLDAVAIVRPADETGPGDRARFWLISDLVDDLAVDDDHQGLTERLLAVPAPDLTGPIAFAITFSVAGALPPAEHRPPAPAQWQMAAASVRGPASGPDAESITPTVPDDLIPALWDLA